MNILNRIKSKGLKTSAIIATTAAVSLFAVLSFAQSLESSLRNTDLLDQPAIPELKEQEQSANRRVRTIPYKAPTIPHSIQGFRIAKDFNQCLVCHAPNVAPMMKAPAVAVSHYQNRDGDYMSNLSARRYFCTQCHVPQAELAETTGAQ